MANTNLTSYQKGVYYAEIKLCVLPPDITIMKYTKYWIISYLMPCTLSRNCFFFLWKARKSWHYCSV